MSELLYYFRRKVVLVQRKTEPFLPLILFFCVYVHFLELFLGQFLLLDHVLELLLDLFSFKVVLEHVVNNLNVSEVKYVLTIVLKSEYGPVELI